MEINWNTKEGKLDIVFRYPHIDTRIVDVKKHILKSSSTIIDNALVKNLKRTNIRWTNGSSTDENVLLSSILTLEIRVGKNHSENISVKKLNDILYNIDKEVQSEIRKLINPKDI